MSSAVSDAGIGTAYEYKAVAYLFGLLAAEGEFPVGGGTVERVGCQRRHKNTGFDDIEVLAREGTSARRWFLQAKRSLYCQPRDPTFREVMQRAQEDVAKPELADAGFVVVSNNVRSDDEAEMRDLLKLARTSNSLADFNDRLEERSKPVKQMYASVVGALTQDNGPPSGETVFAVLRRLRLWHLQLEDYGSTEWRFWRHILRERVPSGSLTEVNALYRTLFALAPESGQFRVEKDFRALRRDVGGFDAPPLSDPTAAAFAGEAIARYRAQLEGWMADRNESAFETLETVGQFTRRALARLRSDHVGGAAKADFTRIVADALALEGLLLTTLEFSLEYEGWFERARPLAERSDYLREALARVSLESGDRPSFQEWFGKVQDPDARTWLASLEAAEACRWDDGVALARSVEGRRRPFALALARACRTEQAAEHADPALKSRLASEALGFAEEALSLAPDLPAFQMVAAEAAMLAVTPPISPAYTGAVGGLPEGLGPRLEESSRFFADVVATPDRYGVHERTLAAHCATRVLAMEGRIPHLRSTYFEDDSDYFLRVSPERQFQMAVLYHQYGADAQAARVLENLMSDRYPADVREHAARQEAVFSQSIRVPSDLSVPSDAPAWFLGERCLRIAFNAMREDRPVSVDTVETVEESAAGTAWVPATKLVAAMVVGDLESARRNCSELIDGYPEAVPIYGELCGLIGQAYQAHLAEFDPARNGDDENHLERRRPLTLAGEAWRECLINLLRHAGQKLGLVGCLDWWIQTSVQPFDSEELERAALACELHRHRDGRWAATFLAEYARPRWSNAADAYESALRQGWSPSSGLRECYDRVRARLGRWEELANDAAAWLKESSRSPRALDPGIHALVQIGRSKEALQLSQDNSDAFPDSADAARTVARTAREIDLEDAILFLMDFSKRFRDDPSAAKEMSQEEAAPMLHAPHPKSPLWAKQADGAFPVHLLGQRLVEEYEGARHRNGLVVVHPGIVQPSTEDFDRPILMDTTAVLIAERLGLWSELSASGIGLVVAPSVIDDLRSERDSLELETRSRLCRASLQWKRLLELISRVPEAVEWGATDEAYRIGGVVVDSWADEDRSLLGLVGASTKVIGRSESRRLESTLRKHMHGSKPDVGEGYAENVVLSPLDIHAVCHANEVDAILACFKRVSVSGFDFEYTKCFFSHALLVTQAADLAARSFESLEAAMESGAVSRIPSEEEPQVSALRYISEVGRLAATDGLAVWVDDASFRAALQAECPGVPTVSTPDVLGELLRRRALSVEGFEEATAETIRLRLFPCLRTNALHMLLDGKDGEAEVRKYVHALCKAMRPGPEEPYGSRGISVDLAARQTGQFIADREDASELVCEQFRRSLPPECAQDFWDRLFLVLAVATRDCWHEVRSMAIEATNAKQYALSSALDRPDWERGLPAPAWNVDQPNIFGLMAFEVRWRDVRNRVLSAFLREGSVTRKDGDTRPLIPAMLMYPGHWSPKASFQAWKAATGWNVH